MGSRDLFVVLLRAAGCYLLATTLPGAVWVLLEPGWSSRAAGLANAGLVGLLSLWMLLGAPALVAWWHPEADGEVSADAGPAAPETPEAAVGDGPPTAWLGVAERCVAWLLVLAAVPYAADVFEQVVGLLRGFDSPSLVGLARSSSVWTLVGCAGGAWVLFARTRHLTAPSP